MRKLLFFVSFWVLFLCFIPSVSAAVNTTACSNRYITLINPVRGRDLWSDKSTKPLVDQYLASEKYKMPATWLLQYDALKDTELTNVIKEFGITGERGIFLEVSGSLAESAGVDYRGDIKWSSPGNVFLSAYTQGERRRLIDAAYNQFKTVFGYYPKPVGAWWIDSYSLSYIKEKYGLSAILIVADQKTTDNYGVWGQWWGYPYIPSTGNLLVPSEGAGLGAVVLQWAQRDPVLAYGTGPLYSNYSLQANDYIRSGKNTDYFKNLTEIYLDCGNRVGQVTIGMETGMEAVGFAAEYDNQLRTLRGIQSLRFVTMSDFSDDYLKVYGKNPDSVSIGNFKMTLNSRANSSLGDSVKYNQNIAFKDYFLPDKSDFLDRQLPVKNASTDGRANVALYLIVIATGLMSIDRKRFSVWLANIFFLIAGAGLVFRSTEIYGWMVYYTPVFKNPYFIQILIYLTCFGIIWFATKKVSGRIKNMTLFLASVPLSYGIDGLLSIIRLTKLSGQYFFGLLAANNTILGITVSSSHFEFVYKIVPRLSLKYFYSFPFDKIFGNLNLYLFAYPLIHIALAVCIYFALSKTNLKLRSAMLMVLAIFYLVFVNIVAGLDPMTVLPLIK